MPGQRLVTFELFHFESFIIAADLEPPPKAGLESWWVPSSFSSLHGLQARASALLGQGVCVSLLYPQPLEEVRISSPQHFGVSFVEDSFPMHQRLGCWWFGDD